jgi:DNA replication protein DnaC
MNQKKPTRVDERVRANLEYLKFRKVLELYSSYAERAARENLSHLDFLDQLLGEEVADKFQRRIETLLRRARLMAEKTIDSYDFNYPKKINKAQVLKLLDLEFIRERSNAIFIGPPGTGKSHLSLAIAHAACKAGIETLFATAIQIVNELHASLSDASFLRCLAKFLKPSLLVIDELGFLPIDKHGSDLLFQVISGRYERGSILLTTNRTFKHWGKIFNDDNTVATAVVDRLIHHAEIITIEGPSYRTRGKESQDK